MSRFNIAHDREALVAQSRKGERVVVASGGSRETQCRRTPLSTSQMSHRHRERPPLQPGDDHAMLVQASTPVLYEPGLELPNQTARNVIAPTAQTYCAQYVPGTNNPRTANLTRSSVVHFNNNLGLT